MKEALGSRMKGRARNASRAGEAIPRRRMPARDDPNAPSKLRHARIIWLSPTQHHQRSLNLLELEPHMPALLAKDLIAGTIATLEPIQHGRRAQPKVFAGSRAVNSRRSCSTVPTMYTNRETW
jgi:hypothetical protein